MVVVQESGGKLTRIANADIGKDVKGKPDIERGVWPVLQRTCQGSGLMWMIAALALFALPPLVGAMRWRALMRMQGIEMSVGKCESLTFIGYLFGNNGPFVVSHAKQRARAGGIPGTFLRTNSFTFDSSLISDHPLHVLT